MITGQDFVQLANRWSSLDSPNGDEAVWRTAIGRAYYGSFHVAMEFLESLGIRQPAGADSRQIHWWVQAVLSKSGDANIVQAGDLLADLHERRKRADYDLRESKYGTQSRAKYCNEAAIEFMSLISGCDAAKFPAIKASIDKWRILARK